MTVKSELEDFMKHIIPAVIFAGLVSFAVQAVADDASSTPPAQSHKQFMKDCMAKAKAANNGTSVQDMRKACHDQMKASMGDTGTPPVVPAH
jgi:hypothetical protein